jgi:hypothetical protein
MIIVYIKEQEEITFSWGSQASANSFYTVGSANTLLAGP